MNITINNKAIDLSGATVSVDDLNDSDNEFSAGLVQVVVSLSGKTMAYQTTQTYDAGGMSSQIAINSESGAYDQMLELLQEHDVIDSDSDEDDQVYAAGKIIGDALSVQKAYDDYMSELGEWQNGGGMDANSETFVAS